MKTKVLEERLKDLGFEKASNGLSLNRILAEKMKEAYKNYLYASKAQIDAFNEKLKKETIEENKNTLKYKTLKFTPIKDYSKIPPEEVLTTLEVAKNENIFDTFEICEIDWHEEIKDPILFGCINGCTDKFFISQWDNDIKIEDIFFREVRSVNTEKS